MSVLEDVRRCARREVPQQLPVFALSQEFDARYCGLTYAEYIRDAETIVACQERVATEFGWDWVWLHLDDCIEFEPLGVGVAAGENIVPATADYLPPTREGLKGLRQPDPQSDGRMPLLLDAIRGLRERFGDEKIVCGRAAAPYSVVGLTFGMAETMLVMMDDPGLLRDMLAFAEEMAIAWGLAQIEGGAHAIWYGDCNASTHLMSPAQFEQWALEPCLRGAEAFQRAGGLVFLHNSEESIEGLRLQAETKPDVLSMGPGVDIAEVKAELGGQIALMGNIDPIHMLQNGTPEQVAEETERQVRLTADGGMILNSGECIPRETPEENMRAMIDMARRVWAEVAAT
jgi:uroporphyrinogen decarboxylase